MKHNDFKYYSNIFYFLIGFTTINAQVVFIREFMIAFYGNELSIGLFLSFWLGWIAAGSISFNLIFKNIKDYYKLISIFLILIAMILPSTIYLIRLIRTLFVTVPGELPGMLPTILSSAIIIAPICLISGAFFALASKSHSRDSATATSAVYKYEAIGSASGGALLSLFFLGNLNSFQLMLFLSFLNIFLAFTLLWDQISKIVKIVLITLCVIFVTVSGNLGTEMHLKTTLMFWKDYSFVESKDSVYGHISVIEIGGEKSIYSNSSKIMSSGNTEAAEELVHYAMLQHPMPQSILLIGSTHPDAFLEILKYKTVKKIDYVELDPVITEISQKYFSQTWKKVNSDNLVNIINEDGRAFTNQNHKKYDIIIVNAGDPLNANINRFYTIEFFENLQNILSENGIFTFQLTAAENYMNDGLTRFLRTINKSLNYVFENIEVIPGESVHFFAANHKGSLNLDPGFIISRLKSRSINNLLVNENYLYFKLLPERVQELEKTIKPNKTTLLNFDFHPIAYYLNLIFWGSQFSSPGSGIFNSIQHLSFEIFILILIIFLSVLFMMSLFRRNKNKIHFILKLVILILGITLVTTELLIVLGFQAVYGYIYNQLAILIGIFMAGIAFGSHLYLKNKTKDVFVQLDKLILLQFVLAFIPLLFLLIISFLPDFIIYFLVFLITFLTGKIGGYIFPLVSKLYFSGNQNIGILYGMDVLGAMTGTVLFGLFCIPVFGFTKVAIILLMINLFAVILIFINRGKIQSR